MILPNQITLQVKKMFNDGHAIPCILRSLLWPIVKRYKLEKKNSRKCSNLKCLFIKDPHLPDGFQVNFFKAVYLGFRYTLAGDCNSIFYFQAPERKYIDL